MKAQRFGEPHLDRGIPLACRFDFGRQTLLHEVAGDKKIRGDCHPRRAGGDALLESVLKQRRAVIQVTGFDSGRVAAHAHSFRETAQVLARAAKHAAVAEEEDGIIHVGEHSVIPKERLLCSKPLFHGQQSKSLAQISNEML